MLKMTAKMKTTTEKLHHTAEWTNAEPNDVEIKQRYTNLCQIVM